MAISIVPLLHGYGLYRFIDSAAMVLAPTITSESGQLNLNSDYLAWHKRDQIVLGWLRSSLSEPFLAQVISSNTSAELWSSLQRNFASTSKARVMELHRWIPNTSKGGMSSAEYVQKTRAAADELAFIRSPMNDEELGMNLLSDLGSEYNPLVVAVNARHEPFSFNELASLLTTHENLLSSQLSVTPNPAAFYSNPNSK